MTYVFYQDEACTEESETQVTGGATFALDATDAPTTFFFGDQSIYPKTVRKDQKVEIRFHYKPTQHTITGATCCVGYGGGSTCCAGAYLKLSLETGFQSPAVAEKEFIRCEIIKEGNPPTKIPVVCKEDSTKVFRFYPAEDISTGSWYEFVLYRQGADSDENGLRQPNTALLNKLTIESMDSSSGTQEIYVHYYSVPESIVTSFNVAPAHRTAGHPNVFTFSFVNDQDILTTDTIVVEFPTVSDNTRDVQYFADDLGQGKHSGAEMKCGRYSTDINAGGTIECRIYNGEKAKRLPATIELTNVSAVNSRTPNTFTVAGIYNPAEVASENDRIIPQIRLYIRDSTGKIREERTHRNTFVTENEDTVTTGTPAPTTSFTTVAETVVAQTFTIPLGNTADIKVGEFIFCNIENKAQFDFTGASEDTDTHLLTYYEDNEEGKLDMIVVDVLTSDITGTDLVLKGVTAPNYKRITANDPNTAAWDRPILDCWVTQEDDSTIHIQNTYTAFDDTALNVHPLTLQGDIVSQAYAIKETPTLIRMSFRASETIPEGGHIRIYITGSGVTGGAGVPFGGVNKNYFEFISGFTGAELLRWEYATDGGDEFFKITGYDDIPSADCVFQIVVENVNVDAQAQDFRVHIYVQQDGRDQDWGDGVATGLTTNASKETDMEITQFQCTNDKCIEG